MGPVEMSSEQFGRIMKSLGTIEEAIKSINHRFDDSQKLMAIQNARIDALERSHDERLDALEKKAAWGKGVIAALSLVISGLAWVIATFWSHKP